MLAEFKFSSDLSRQCKFGCKNNKTVQRTYRYLWNSAILLTLSKYICEPGIQETEKEYRQTGHMAVLVPGGLGSITGRMLAWQAGGLKFKPGQTTHFFSQTAMA